MKVFLPVVCALFAWIARNGRNEMVRFRDITNGVVYSDTGKGFVIPATALCDSMQFLVSDTNYAIVSFSYTVERPGMLLSASDSVSGDTFCASKFTCKPSDPTLDSSVVTNITPDNWGFRKGDRVFLDDLRVVGLHDHRFRYLGSIVIRVAN